MVELKDSQYLSAAEKRRVLKQWETFLKHGCQEKHFTGPLYNHLTMHCSFIAHYNKAGFYGTYFTNGEDTAHFLTQFDNRNGIPQSIEYGRLYWYTSADYNDINAEMCRIAAKYIDGLTQKAGERQEAADIIEARRLLSKHGIPLNA